MATTKYLDYAGLERLLTKLFDREFRGMGLSTNDFTDALKTKLDSLAAPEDLTALSQKVSQLEALVAVDSDGVINKFNEIVSFLAGIGDDKTLKGMFADIATQVANAASALDEYKSEAEGKYVAKVSGKGLSTNDYTDADKTAVATIGNKVEKVSGKGLSTNDYTDADKAAVATIGDKLDASDVAAITSTEIDTLLTQAGV